MVPKRTVGAVGCLTGQCGQCGVRNEAAPPLAPTQAQAAAHPPLPPAACTHMHTHTHTCAWTHTCEASSCVPSCEQAHCCVRDTSTSTSGGQPEAPRGACPCPPSLPVSPCPPSHSCCVSCTRPRLLRTSSSKKHLGGRGGAGAQGLIGWYGGAGVRGVGGYG